MKFVKFALDNLIVCIFIFLCITCIMDSHWHVISPILGLSLIFTPKFNLCSLSFVLQYKQESSSV